MTAGRPNPPAGNPPPTSAPCGDATLLLEPLAREVCRRYAGEFPDEDERYGPAGSAWCIHDNQYLLSWAADFVRGYVDLHRQVAWLASVLEARAFPLARLARNLDLAAAVVRDEVADDAAARLAEALDDAAALVRSRPSFLDLGDYEQAALAGDTTAAFDLGLLLSRADPPDLVGARRWWEQAATAGHSGAAFHLGVLLHTRLDPPELDAARSWYEYAAAAGHADAATCLATLRGEPDSTDRSEDPPGGPSGRSQSSSRPRWPRRRGC